MVCTGSHHAPKGYNAARGSNNSTKMEAHSASISGNSAARSSDPKVYVSECKVDALLVSSISTGGVYTKAICNTVRPRGGTLASTKSEEEEPISGVHTECTVYTGSSPNHSPKNALWTVEEWSTVASVTNAVDKVRNLASLRKHNE